MADIIDAAEGYWRDAVARWEAAVADFSAAIDAHYALRPIAEQLGPEELQAWQTTLDRGLKIKTAIEMLQENLAAGSNWVKQTFGFGGTQHLQGLGNPIIGLVPVAVVVGSISAVVVGTEMFLAYRNQLASKWDYMNAHPEMTPTEVAAVLNAGNPDLTGGLSSIGAWIVIGGLALVFLPKLLHKGN